MNDTDRELMDRLLDDDLSPVEQADLLERIEADSEGAAQFAERALLHAGLRRALRRDALQHAALATVGGVEAGAEEKILVMPQARFRRVVAAWAAAACFVVVAALVSVFMLTSASASPAAIVQRALKVHAAMLDRCYRVSGGWDSARRDDTEPRKRETRVWTRGDRFWVEARMDGKTAVWGRDEAGRVWFTSSPDEGGWFDADEVPERLAQVCDLRSLQPESLLRSVLADFDLRREPDAAGNHLIHAELKPRREHPLYHGALLEMDAASGVLRRAVVERVAPGRSRVPVTFMLVETGLLDDATYTLAGHLTADAEIYDRHSSPGQRTRALAEFVRFITGRDRANLPSR